MSNVKFYNVDCMEHMASVPDKYYDLAIVDPPYGIFEKGKASISGGGKTKNRPKFLDDGKMKNWDIAPPKEYFLEVFRISKNQIICGGNNFELPPTRGFIIWDKGTTAPTYAQYDYFWTSFNCLPKIAKIRLLKGFLKELPAIHPTQKPVALYKWLLTHYAKEGDKIFDSHGGSMSSAIACNDLHFDLDICELDKDYFDVGVKRFNNHIAQTTLF